LFQQSTKQKQKLATHGQVIDNLCQDMQGAAWHRPHPYVTDLSYLPEEHKDNKCRFQAMEGVFDIPTMCNTVTDLSYLQKNAKLTKKRINANFKI